MNITEAGVVNSPSESGTNDNPCFNDTQLKETFLMRRTTATTDYLKECMGTVSFSTLKTIRSFIVPVYLRSLHSGFCAGLVFHSVHFAVR